MVIESHSRKHLFLLTLFLILLLSMYVFKNKEIIHSWNLSFKLTNSSSSTTTPSRTSSSQHPRDLTFPEPLVSGIPLNSTPSEAFVTFCNNNPKYLALLTNVIDSVHQFSTRPIIAYGIDVDLNIDSQKYPRLIKRRLNRNECGSSIYFCKFYSIVQSQIDYGIYIEADTLVNWNVDILFDVLHQWPYPLPLAPRHPNDPMNYRIYLNKFKLDLQNRTTPYVHAHMLWNYRAYPFLQQAHRLMRQGYFSGASFDETGVNVLLWQAKANHTLCKMDPYFSFLSAYESNQMVCHSECHTAYILVHGAKDASTMHELLERLKQRAGAPFIQTTRHGFHYLNETQYTCCYPDSQRSLIHPLLCEHRIR